MSTQCSALCSMPYEVLELIVFQVVSYTPLGPPSALLPILLACRDLYLALAAKYSPDLYAKIFKFKFDHVAVVRRAFKPRSSQYVQQLGDYCRLLQKIRSGNIFSIDIDSELFMAFIMMVENDGKNKAQLQWAGIDNFVDRFVRVRLHDRRGTNNGWPRESPQNACALWLMWILTTEEKLRAETESQRQEIIDLILPYVLVTYRYISAEVPPNHFRLPFEISEEDLPHSVVTAHGEYPRYRDASPLQMWSQVHYGSRPEMAPPLLTVAAKLIYFSRREVIPFGIPTHLPLNRAHAFQMGIQDAGPTQEDVIEFNSHPVTRLVKPTRWDWWESLTDEQSEKELNGVPGFGDLTAPSASWDNDWWRMRTCHSAWSRDRIGPVYNPGTLTGLWQGRMLIPGEGHFNSLIVVQDFPPDFSEAYFNVSHVPIYMRLQEHHCMSPNEPIICGGDDHEFDDGMSNAYFPDDMQMSQMIRSDGSGTVTVYVDGASAEYETYVPGRVNRHDPQTCLSCIAIAKERERLKAEKEAEPFEHHFDEIGLGRKREMVVCPDGTEFELEPPEHDENKIFPCTGIEDIILTGQTDERHGFAWNHYRYYGRIRSWDGLIGILRIPLDPRLGNIFLYGYIIGGQNFVGNWRIAHADVGMPAWESAFTMSRRDD